jgi:hypothetical protein
MQKSISAKLLLLEVILSVIITARMNNPPCRRSSTIASGCNGLLIRYIDL